MWYQHDGCPTYFSLVTRNKDMEILYNQFIKFDITGLFYGNYFILWETLKNDLQKRITL